MKQEKENLIRKNKDKIIDIQCLNEQNEKLNKLLEKYKEEKSIFTNKLVSLENDIVHYQNKIRECEDFIEELKYQLENALEENITIYTLMCVNTIDTRIHELVEKKGMLADAIVDGVVTKNKEELLEFLLS